MIREDLPSAQFQKQQKQKIGPLTVIFLEKFATVGEFLSGKVCNALIFNKNFFFFILIDSDESVNVWMALPNFGSF